MRIAIFGAAGMLGRKLTERLLADGRLGRQPIDQLVLTDIVPPQTYEASVAVEKVPGDFVDAELVRRVLAGRPDVIFHLAAVVSGEAEADFAKGYRVNVAGTRGLFEAVRLAHEAEGYHPRLVFASSIAVFGAPLPDPIPEDYPTRPLTSYGTQKAIGELLLADYSRRGFFDGIGIRLPTVCIRPGRPNQAASGFFSSILREPLAGQPAVLPVPDTVRHWFASPRSAVGFLLHVATFDTGQLHGPRNLSMPGSAPPWRRRSRRCGRWRGRRPSG